MEEGARIDQLVRPLVEAEGSGASDAPEPSSRDGRIEIEV
jgi:hypothetical protein